MLRWRRIQERTAPSGARAAAAGGTRAVQSLLASVRSPQAPFDDVRVRKAMQLAIDLETLNNALFDGLGDMTPRGILGGDTVGFQRPPTSPNVPYDEWTDQLKADYGYDPDRAEKLLDEAGYARGADGVRFKTQLHTRISPSADLDWTQAAKDYWAQIGVDALMPIMALRINSVNVPTTVVADHPTAVPGS